MWKERLYLDFLTYRCLCSHFITCKLCRGEVEASSICKTNYLLYLGILHFRWFLIFPHIHLDIHFAFYFKHCIQSQRMLKSQKPNALKQECFLVREGLLLPETEYKVWFSFTLILGLNAQKRQLCLWPFAKVDPGA